MNTDSDYEAFVKKVAANLKKIRIKRGLTQEEMFTKHGFNYRFYQRLESGTHSFNLFTLYRLAKALRVRVRDFVA